MIRWRIQDCQPIATEWRSGPASGGGANTGPKDPILLPGTCGWDRMWKRGSANVTFILVGP